MRAVWWARSATKAATGWSICCAKSWASAAPTAHLSGTGKLLDHLGRDRPRPDLARIGWIAAGPYAGLEAFDTEHAVGFLQQMRDLEARALDLGHRRLDRHVVAEARRN